jgi:hypothetical protein
MKKPNTIVSVEHKKKPACVVEPLDFYKRHPAWRFSRSKKYSSSKYGWTSLNGKLFYVVEKLHDLEVQTWADIFRDRKKHHSISVNDLIPEVQRLLHSNREDVDTVFSIHISSKERIFGIIEPGFGVLDIIWWDPEHEICPSQKKHT